MERHGGVLKTLVGAQNAQNTLTPHETPRPSRSTLIQRGQWAAVWGTCG